MTDATSAAAPAKAKVPVKSSKGGAVDAGSDGKKRFEVKKVYFNLFLSIRTWY